ncbi:MRPS7 [Bugula neritina]|uniref:MRPS7 n=1 Tax=Bugula neritina TaxID=10212 RepID=A0A7J7IZW1_BUGNE|nr:MRPS7 [Bugula neritina]
MAAPIKCVNFLKQLNSSIISTSLIHRINAFDFVHSQSAVGSNRTLTTSTPAHSVYNPRYVEPFTDKSKLPSSIDDFGERVFLPVKALVPSHKITHYHDPLVERFINCCMSHGERNLAKEIVAKAFERIKLIQLDKYYKAQSDFEREQIICDPLKIFHLAFANVKPVFRLLRHIKSGTIYMVPIAAKPNQAELMAFCWLRDSAKNKPKFVSFWDALARELIDASQNTGKSVRKKLDLHRQCNQNKAYAHFIWTK